MYAIRSYYDLIVQKLQANPDAFGIFGFSFLDQNLEKVKGASIDGVAPTFDAIADGDYPVSRPLYFYVKKAHVDVIPGLRGFLVITSYSIHYTKLYDFSPRRIPCP